jgi:hypothetical protein
MASSLASIAETWPENVLPQWQQKIADAENNCSSIPKPERLKRLQAGVKPPLNKAQQMSAEGTKDLSPLQGFLVFGNPSPGANTPVCNLLAPSGLYRNL